MDAIVWQVFAAAGASFVAATLAAIEPLIRRWNRTESEYAEQVFERIPQDRDPEVVRHSARPGKHFEDVAPINRFALQEAEIYLQHHRLALKHYSAYQRASLWSGLLGFLLVLVGAGLAYFAGLDVGVLTAVAGAIPAAAAGLLFRQANILSARATENLRGLEAGVRRFNALEAALAVTEKVDDPGVRDRMFERISTQMLAPAEDLMGFVREAQEAGRPGEPGGP
ncbi:hypothetical protein AB0A73_03380 [Glycomyces sp. NPDC047369]